MIIIIILMELRIDAIHLFKLWDWAVLIDTHRKITTADQ